MSIKININRTKKTEQVKDRKEGKFKPKNKPRTKRKIKEDSENKVERKG